MKRTSGDEEDFQRRRGLPATKAIGSRRGIVDDWRGCQVEPMTFGDIFDNPWALVPPCARRLRQSHDDDDDDENYDDEEEGLKASRPIRGRRVSERRRIGRLGTFAAISSKTIPERTTAVRASIFCGSYEYCKYYKFSQSDIAFWDFSNR